MLTTAQKNVLADAYKNIDELSLHDGDPGATGANESGFGHAPITWSASSNGVVTATATFPGGVTGDFTYLGFWDGATFCDSKPVNISMDTPQTLKVSVEHAVADG